MLLLLLSLGFTFFFSFISIDLLGYLHWTMTGCSFILYMDTIVWMLFSLFTSIKWLSIAWCATSSFPFMIFSFIRSEIDNYIAKFSISISFSNFFWLTLFYFQFILLYLMFKHFFIAISALAFPSPNPIIVFLCLITQWLIFILFNTSFTSYSMYEGISTFYASLSRIKLAQSSTFYKYSLSF